MKKKIVSAIIGMVLGALTVVTVRETFNFLNDIKEERDRDYDYICVIDWDNSSDERIDVERYWLYEDSGVMKFELQNGDLGYIELRDKSVVCTKYIDDVVE